MPTSRRATDRQRLVGSASAYHTSPRQCKPSRVWLWDRWSGGRALTTSPV